MIFPRRRVSAGLAVDVAPSCTDADIDPLTYTIGSQGSKGTASVVNGGLRYSANAGTSGTDTFTYTADDGRGAVSAPATVTITITPVADCSAVTRTITRSVADWYGSAFAGTTKLRDNTQLTEMISDGLRFHLGILPGLDPRARAVGSFVLPFQTNIDWVTGTAQNLPAEAALRAALATGLATPVFDPVITHTPARYLLATFVTGEACPGDPSRTVQVTNDFVAVISFFELNVREGTPVPTNQVPVCTARSGSVTAGLSVDVAPSCTDPDTDPLTYTIAAQGTKGTAAVIAGQLRYTANTATSGTDSLTYTANDGRGGVSAPATVTVPCAGREVMV